MKARDTFFDALRNGKLEAAFKKVKEDKAQKTELEGLRLEACLRHHEGFRGHQSWEKVERDVRMDRTC